jgi:hypothetical protein
MNQSLILKHQNLNQSWICQKHQKILTQNEYLESRKLNPDKFYYTDKFKSWTNSLKDVFDDTTKDEPRIIIPLFYQNTLVGFQGRALGPSKIKYITVMLNDDAPKIYGLDELKKVKLYTSQKVHSTQLSFQLDCSLWS